MLAGDSYTAIITGLDTLVVQVWTAVTKLEVFDLEYRSSLAILVTAAPSTSMANLVTFWGTRLCSNLGPGHLAALMLHACRSERAGGAPPLNFPLQML